jgi:hypothetical protein
MQLRGGPGGSVPRWSAGLCTPRSCPRPRINLSRALGELVGYLRSGSWDQCVNKLLEGLDGLLGPGKLMTRTPVSKDKNLAAIGCGDPTPIVIKGLHRVLNLNAQVNFSHAGLETSPSRTSGQSSTRGCSRRRRALLGRRSISSPQRRPTCRPLRPTAPKTRPRSSTSSIPLSRYSHWPRSSREEAKASSSTRAPSDAASSATTTLSSMCCRRSPRGTFR